MKPGILISFLFFSIQLNTAKAQPASFVFTNDGTNAAMDSAINYTGQIWSSYVSSSIPIKVHVHYVFMIIPGLKMVTISNVRKDFSNASFDSTWYPTSLANKLQMTELNPGEADMDIFISDAIPWYLGTDMQCPETAYDFVTFLLREIGHGLGMMSLVKVENDTVGSIGTITAAELNEFQPTSYAYPDLEMKHAVFTRFVENGAGEGLDNQLLFPNPSSNLFDQYTSDDLYFNGPNSFIANNLARIPLYTPNVYEPGRSLQHINEADYSPLYDNSLMSPDLMLAEVHHRPGEVNLGILEDIGWTVDYHIGMENEFSENSLNAFPNPSTHQVSITGYHGDDLYAFTLLNAQGNIMLECEVVEMGEKITIDLSELPGGIYIAIVNGKAIKIVKK